MEENRGSFRKEVFEYVKRKYGSNTERLWRRYPNYGVFRHEDNRKWYGLVMDVPENRLGPGGDTYVDVLNVKIDDLMLRDILLAREGYYPGYHISRGNWISVRLDGTVEFDEITGLIDISYEATASKKKKQKLRSPKEWIIPANPKYYDIEHAFDSADEIRWKQGSGIRAGDTVFIYVAAPVSAVLFQCLVTKTDIPYEYENPKLTIKALMMIKLVRRYDPDRFTFTRLNEEFGVHAVRGPRGIPNTLSEAFKAEGVPAPSAVR